MHDQNEQIMVQHSKQFKIGSSENAQSFEIQCEYKISLSVQQHTIKGTD